jgi:hypothetical protein
MSRAACYIDGFNLYHAVDDLNRPHLKWVNLYALAESLCGPGEALTKVAYFSAYTTWMPPSYARHRQYVAALKHYGVECHMARFSETDVNFSLTVLGDALDDIFDRLIIVSADSDHVPAVRMVRSRFPGKQVFVATPPNTHANARELLKVANSSTTITARLLAKCLLPATVVDVDGNVIAVRPAKYASPA